MKLDTLRGNIAAISRLAAALMLCALPALAQEEDSEAAPAQQGGHYEVRQEDGEPEDKEGSSISAETEEASNPSADGAQALKGAGLSGGAATGSGSRSGSSGSSGQNAGHGGAPSATAPAADSGKDCHTVTPTTRGNVWLTSQGACTIIPFNFKTDRGGNFNIKMSRGQSVSFQFTTPSAPHAGSTLKEVSTTGRMVGTFMNISARQGDFTYPDIYIDSLGRQRPGKRYNGCGHFDGITSVKYKVEIVDSHSFGRCSLRPNTVYYINIRNEHIGNPGVDTCPEGTTCGYLFQMH